MTTKQHPPTTTLPDNWESQSVTCEQLDTAMRRYLVDKRIAADMNEAKHMIRSKIRASMAGDVEATQLLIETMVYAQKYAEDKAAA